MVYCAKCGALNATATQFVSNVALPFTALKRKAALTRDTDTSDMKRIIATGERRGVLAGLVFGFVIIIIGLSLLLGQVYSVDIPWWSIIILIGVYVVLRGIMRSRRYGQ
jgi:hypothetical protein